jgi:hypothetical protein
MQNLNNKKYCSIIMNLEYDEFINIKLVCKINKDKIITQADLNGPYTIDEMGCLINADTGMILGDGSSEFENEIKNQY